MFKTEPLALSTLLIAVPLTHLIITSVYLLCYCIGFGGNVGAFISVDDVFSTSLTQVAPIYVTGLLFPGLLILWRHSWKYPYEADRIAAMEDPVRQRQAALHLKVVQSALFVTALVSLAIALVRIGDAYLRATHIPVFTLSILTFTFGPIILGRYLGRGKITWRVYEVATLALMFSASALASGVDRGQSDRIRDYASLSEVRPMCGDYAVLRKISGQMLAAGPRNERVLLDEDCNQIVEFQNPAPRGYLRWGWRPIVLLPS